MVDRAPLRTLRDFFEPVFTVAALLILSGGPLPLLRRQVADPYDPTRGDPIIQAVLAAVYVVTFLLVLARWRRAFVLLGRDRILLVLLGLAVVSAAWSVAPEMTIRRSFALAGTTLFGVYLAARYSSDQILRLLAVALGLAALFSLTFELALPDLVVSEEAASQGAWHGIYTHKNILGRVMALGGAVFLLTLARGGARIVSFAAFALCAWVLVKSDSMTSTVIVVTIAGLLPVFRTLRWRPTAAAPAICVVMALSAVGVVWAAGHIHLTLAALGRDITLTGRTALWLAVIDSALQRPWLGFGYSSFWLGWKGESMAVWLATSWDAMHAHNGFLDLWLDLGVLGVAVFLVGFGRTMARAGRWIRQTPGAFALWPMAFLAFMLLYNLSESAILRENSIFWALYVAVALTVADRRPSRAVGGTPDSVPGATSPEASRLAA
ncbi:MAG TPA: O-antigen ligase [Longimicrobiales bacterium]|nr:O-antigen ligase [Longimicrobiales bacterium]